MREATKARRENNYPLIGTEFGYWIVLDNENKVRSDGAGHHVIYCCCQSCDNTYWVKRHKLIDGGSTHCKKCTSVLNFIGVGDLSGDYVSRIRNGAKNRKIEFNVSIKYLWELFLQQNKKCKLSGIALSMQKFRKNKKVNQTASLDRIDSSKGYIEGNIQWVHKDINNMKMNFNQEYFIELCKKVTKNNE